MTYDIAIVGGGLSGCFAAFHLAKAGLKVVVIEEHPFAGEPRFCTGIIGKEAFDRFDLPTAPIQNTYSSAVFYSPFGNHLRVSKSEPQAFIVNRAKFDQELAQNAMSAGAEFYYSNRCIHFESQPDRIFLTIQGENGLERKVNARMAILSTGTYYGLHPKVGRVRPNQFLDTAQVEVEANDIREVEVYFGAEIAPGSFAWASPLSPGRARIGISTYKNAHYHLTRFLESDYFKERIPEQILEIKRKVIPISPIKSTHGHRFLIIGDAAGQVKPTTGGGIYYGLLSAYLASQNIIEAFQKDCFEESHFSLYQKEWKKEIGKELRIGLITRKLLRYITDHQIDSLIRFLQQEESLAIIQKYADFDWHHNIILALSREPFFWLHLSRHILGMKTEVILPRQRTKTL
ncbi:MAG: NAD(P)/FAD-dependent oxidoreductase [Nitrospirae bacterium]|nr:NAD(P)/FAD-dependent oxidoreductase [Nitrospirota bacterium]